MYQREGNVEAVFLSDKLSPMTDVGNGTNWQLLHLLNDHRLVF
ncbi:MAG TPA: hypothetical protein VKV29_11895 [Chthonomonas sp.]|nr:hypothetical protein [Chthonomonas sp.]HLH80970.1 hypothetical protein [Chthonomonas sp.]